MEQVQHLRQQLEAAGIHTLKFIDETLDKLVAIDPLACCMGQACEDILKGKEPDAYHFYLFTSAVTSTQLLKQFKAIGIDVAIQSWADTYRWRLAGNIGENICYFTILKEREDCETLMTMFLPVHLQSCVPAWDRRNSGIMCSMAKLRLDSRLTVD